MRECDAARRIEYAVRVSHGRCQPRYEIIVGLWFLWFLDRKLALARCKPAVRGTSG